METHWSEDMTNSIFFVKQNQNLRVQTPRGGGVQPSRPPGSTIASSGASGSHPAVPVTLCRFLLVRPARDNPWGRSGRLHAPEAARTGPVNALRRYSSWSPPGRWLNGHNGHFSCRPGRDHLGTSPGGGAGTTDLNQVVRPRVSAGFPRDATGKKGYQIAPPAPPAIRVERQPSIYRQVTRPRAESEAEPIHRDPSQQIRSAGEPA